MTCPPGKCANDVAGRFVDDAASLAHLRLRWHPSRVDTALCCNRSLARSLLTPNLVPFLSIGSILKTSFFVVKNYSYLLIRSKIAIILRLLDSWRPSTPVLSGPASNFIYCDHLDPLNIWRTLVLSGLLETLCAVITLDPLNICTSLVLLAPLQPLCSLGDTVCYFLYKILTELISF